ncbi:RNA 3'-terminal phosphate cyclase [Flocculibacter collagenilyticus]|uniref:RNA 3'-terminal phosphate cyclase n=1 Tax=Flocculibacter collagenilyticus TaxID=2744479 RepID=UPI0018F69145|nr:RNA 3'-terminal phosphate cyclase [Flocculibacter collagenilyticus]
MSYLVIDGAQGEGGGQVLRTALTLSMLTKQPIELINIRANRNKPGLLRQHLTCVLAAQQICDASVAGVELGASRIRFAPNKVKAGDYHFSIGTAGSTVLVCQTILPVLGLAQTASNITFEGGTHNGMSPSLCFLKQSYLPILQSMGIHCEINTERLGFYPAGGGKWQLNIKPTESLTPINLLNAGSEAASNIQNCKLNAFVSLLPKSIGQREIATAKQLLEWKDAAATVSKVTTAGTGNSFQLHINSNTHTHVFETIGEHGVSAENVAKRCANRVKKFISANAAVEEYLADQLLLPFALAGHGSFTTTKPSLHTTTNINVIQCFLNLEITTQQESDQLWQIDIRTSRPFNTEPCSI